MSWLRPRRDALVGILVCSFTVSAVGQIRWRSAEPQDMVPMAAADIGNALRDAAGLDAGRHVIVQLSAPATAGVRLALADAGVTMLASLGDNSFFAYVSAADLDVRRIDAIGALGAVAEIDRAHKLHPDLLAAAPPEHAIVGRITAPFDEIVAAYAIFHRNVPLETAAQIAHLHGAVVRDVLETVNGLVIELPGARIDGLVERTEVQWIEPALPRLSTTNAENRVITQVDAVQQPPFGLDGTGVVALIYDSGNALAGHADFSGRLTTIDVDSLSDHSTHVAGTVGGDGSVTLNNRGMILFDYLT